MTLPKFQISILGILVLTAFVCIGISVWQQQKLSKENSELKTRLGEIEEDFLIRSRFIAMLGGLRDSESDAKTLELAKSFTYRLSELEIFGETREFIFSGAGCKAELIEIDAEDGQLQLLVLTTTAKVSPGWDRSIIALFDAGQFVQAIPIETYYRIWHEVIIEDTNDDGIDDVKIQEYVPGDPAAGRQVTKETVYTASVDGFTLHEVRTDFGQK